MKELVAYITTGYPDREFTVDLALSLVDAGADRLEIGVPFSDAAADGPVIEAANLRAIAAGFRLDDAFWVGSKLSAPFYYMGYFNSFYAKGFDNFLHLSKSSGAKGLIIPDLPLEEGRGYAKSFEQTGLANIPFIATTHAQKRIEAICEKAQEFIYLVAFAGITGADRVEDLQPTLQAIKQRTKTPVFVGFGVNEQTAKQKVEGADGVIVGTAFVKHLLDDTLSNSEKMARIVESAKTIKGRINE